MRRIKASVSIALFAVSIFSTATASAAVTGFNPGRIIDDSVMTHSSSMSPSAIQGFLSAKLPTCDTWGTQPYGGTTRAQYAASRGVSTPFTCLKDYSENGKTSAQIIYDVSQKYSINPQVLIVLLQKEQGLVTDDWPWPIQYRSATGYGCPDTAPCDSQYYGLTNQLDWSAKMFRAIINNSPTWYTPYVLGDNYIQYSPDASCGGSVVTIQNRSTQALYNYTPYQPNPGALAADWGTAPCGAYGNRNFYLYFTSWFGTPTGPRYAWQYVSQIVYSDSTRTQAYSYETTSMVPGSKAYITLKAKNTGGTPWKQDTVRLGTSNSSDRASQFADTSWIHPARIGLIEPTVYPGETGTFNFSITAPTKIGTYREHFNLVAEGITWFNDIGMHLNIDVLNTRSPSAYYNGKLNSSEEVANGHSVVSPDEGSLLNMQSDGNLVLYHDFRLVWSSGSNVSPGKKLVMQSDGNLVVVDSAGQPVWSTNTGGNPGAHLSLQSDGNMVVYSSSGSPLWSTGTNTNPNGLDRVNSQINLSSRMFVNQYLTTADQYYKFILQGDGNLVLYANNRALWSSNTYGKPSAFLDMQGDGNLVLYSKQGTALWSSGTDRRQGSKLIMQSDGNLVVYSSSGSAIWSTSTANVR